jgi:hypothetical protein
MEGIVTVMAVVVVGVLVVAVRTRKGVSVNGRRIETFGSEVRSSIVSHEVNVQDVKRSLSLSLSLSLSPAR